VYDAQIIEKAGDGARTMSETRPKEAAEETVETGLPRARLCHSRQDQAHQSASGKIKE
jgi:hypothetical protein